MKRRSWLLSATGAAGALVIGWSLLPPRSRLGSASHPWPALDGIDGENGRAEGVVLNGWIKVKSDGSVVLAMPRSEMGQGVHTALAMLVAEEMDLPLVRVSVEQAGGDAIYGNVAMLVGSLPFHPLERDDLSEDGAPRVRPTTVRLGEWMMRKLARELGINATGGSSSVADAWEVVRTAAATARGSLLGAASLDWKLPVAELMVTDGVMSHPSGPSAHYGELARFAAATPPGEVRLKSRQTWKLIGRPAPRLDIPAKTNGQAVFGVDVRLPGMVYAAVRMCPMLGGSPGAVDPAAALAMPGVERIVRLQGFAGSTAGFAVVGATWWHAQQGALAVKVDWQQRPAGALDSARIERDLLAALDTGPAHTFYTRGDVTLAQGSATRTVESVYRAPYLAHATLEPMNCTAQVAGGKVRLWVPTQVPQMAVAQAAQVAGVALEDVSVTVTLLGGGFGRRLEVDVVAQAVRVAMECGGRPVQLMWSREEDTTHDFYRPMQVARLRAWFGPDGRVSGVSLLSAGDAITPRWLERNAPGLASPVDAPDKSAAEGLFDVPYRFAHQQMAQVATRSHVPVGYWRSVGHSHNAFFIESFMDELALQAGMDPVAFRLPLLQEAPRHRAVLTLAAAKAGWGTPLPAGRARGVALHESFGTIVAQVVEVSLAADSPRVHRVVCALDCGTVVNPGVVAQQMEGSVVFALSAALHGRIDITEGVVRQRNFPGHPLVSLRDAPQVETYLVPSGRAPAGVGEPGVPPLAPALANALFALSGRRQRQLPLRA
ncbi:molybdopterin cofactor-binding domain-containing protein [Polaromonas sp. YR568]|uniref:xanthine dehydrogenase family protein molybdopterin-binding subunit n=1 Tax=Polaromonas sp. YR568 TaxID=1855301 RepID=UPI0031380127